MDANESRPLLEQLSAALGDAGFDWILREVAAAIQEGRPQRRIRVSSQRRSPALLPSDEPAKEYDRSREHTRTEPYTKHEQMQMLADAVEQLFADSASLNAELVSEFRRITFRSEGRLGEEPTFTVDKESVEHHAEASKRVEKVLRDMRVRSDI